MVTTTSIIDPAGGGDYTTFTAWWTAQKANSNDLVARFKAGGDLCSSFLNLDTNTPASITIEPFDVSHQHDGASGGGFASSGFQVFTFAKSLTIKGLRFTSTFLSLGTTVNNTLSLQNILAASTAATVAINAAGAVTHDVTIRNSILMGGAQSATTNAAAVMNLTLQNCTLRRNSATLPAFRFVRSSAGTINATIENCYLYNLDAGGGFGEVGSTATVNRTINNCATHDATGDDYGGSGNLISKAAANCFIDPTNGDFRLKSGSPLFDTGKTIAAVTTDIIGTARPQFSAYDIGAFESLTNLANPSLGNVRSRRLRRWRE